MSRELLRQALDALKSIPEAHECLHEETERLGVMWTRCQQCGRKWTDEDGPPKHRHSKVAGVMESIRAELAKPDPLAWRVELPKTEADEFTDYWDARWMETPALRAEFKATSVEDIARQAFEAGRGLAKPEPAPEPEPESWPNLTWKDVPLADEAMELAYKAAWHNRPEDVGYTSRDWFVAGARYAFALAAPQPLPDIAQAVADERERCAKVAEREYYKDCKAAVAIRKQPTTLPPDGLQGNGG